jgi:hypothetical protein
MIQAGKAYLGKVPVQVGVSIGETWQRSEQSQPKLHDGVGCKMWSLQFDLTRFTPQVSDLVRYLF